MNKAVTQESELQLCARILRALAHRIRGDLSVITNDLAYIATIIDPAEVERSRARCGAISAGLGHFGVLGSCSDEKQVTNLEQLLRSCGLSAAIDFAAAEAAVIVSPGLFELAVSLLRELVGEIDGYFKASKNLGWITIVPRSRRNIEFSERYDSLRTFAAAQLGERFVVEAGLADLIFRDHGWEVAVLCEDQRVKVQISIDLI